MKKWILCMLLATSCMLQAQNKFEVLPKAAFDWYLDEYKFKENTDYFKTFAKYRVRTGIDVKFKGFTASYDVHTYMSQRAYEGKKVEPTNLQLFMGLKYQYKKFSIKYEYMSMRPVNTNNIYLSQAKVFGRYNMVSLQYNYLI